MAETRRIQFHAQWEEDLPADVEFKLGDLIEVEGHDLTVTEVYEPPRALKDRQSPGLPPSPIRSFHLSVSMTDEVLHYHQKKIDEAKKAEGT